MTKDLAIHALHAALQSQLETLETMTDAARDEATNAESRPENKYDTRALEASYLAAGQGERLTDLRRITGWLATARPRAQHTIGIGALVCLDDGGALRWVLVAPHGGPSAAVGSETVQLLGARSPLAAALAGLEQGDSAEVRSPLGRREVEVITVA